MTKPASYPFFQIAKRHGMDYGDVLMVADSIRVMLKGNDDPFLSLEKLLFSLPQNMLGAINEVIAACLEYRAVQRGEIDWLTGERK